MTLCICQQCGKTFDKQNAWIRRSDANYCSPECYQQSTKNGLLVACPNCGRETYKSKSQIEEGRRFCSSSCYNAIRQAEQVTKTCPVCQKTFTVKASAAHRYTVCSWACRTTGQKQYICQRCGNTFASSEARWIPQYCSETCRRPPQYTSCQQCGKRFRKTPGDTDRRFCCFSCYRKSVGETSLERAVRQSLENLGIHYVQEFQIGRYCIDFLLTDLGIALEADGEYWHRNKAREQRRTIFLEKHGWSVVRIREEEVLNADNLNDLIRQCLQKVVGSQ